MYPQQARERHAPNRRARSTSSMRELSPDSATASRVHRYRLSAVSPRPRSRRHPLDMDTPVQGSLREGSYARQRRADVARRRRRRTGRCLGCATAPGPPRAVPWRSRRRTFSCGHRRRVRVRRRAPRSATVRPGSRTRTRLSTGLRSRCLRRPRCVCRLCPQQRVGDSCSISSQTLGEDRSRIGNCQRPRSVLISARFVDSLTPFIGQLRRKALTSVLR